MNISIRAISSTIDDNTQWNISLNDLSNREMDQIRSLLKSIFDYGQFSDPKEISAQLELSPIINEIIKVTNKK